MRDNYNTLIEGERVVLVPYKRKFVEKYHQWMQDTFLQEMTASEPLSLEGEYEMQQSWREDSKKCTFILLSKADGERSELDRMVGDVNLFLNDRDDPTVAELEVMVAESTARRQGIGREAVQLMMHYALTALGITRFYVKINEVNTSSLTMFERCAWCGWYHLTAAVTYVVLPPVLQDWFCESEVCSSISRT
jgi:RimJ/RimL family protein N-acetyltransferase